MAKKQNNAEPLNRRRQHWFVGHHHIAAWLFLVLCFSAVVWMIYYMSYPPPASQTQNAVQNPPNQSANDDNWQNYTNTEAGFAFEYPKGYEMITSSENKELDTGKVRTISVFSDKTRAFNVSAFSSDYRPYISEGCCYDIKGSFNLNLSLAQLEVSLEKQLGHVYELKKVKIDNKDALRFYRLNQYTQVWVVDTLLIPINYNGFSNILISSPDLAVFNIEGKNETQTKQALNQAVKSAETAIKDKAFTIDKDEYEIFNKILATFKVTDLISLVSVKAHGGLCVTGQECESTFEINMSGETKSTDGKKGRLAVNEIQKLKTLIGSTDFAEIKNHKFTGVCPVAYDGQELIYNFTINNKTESIASCTYDTERNELFKYINELRQKYAF